ncbi:MAG TPA: hypothetical protein VIH40_00310 [Xanthobacteraceae bacterium]
MDAQPTALEIANAETAIILSLLETLVDKKILSNAEVRRLLTNSVSRLRPHEYAVPAGGAAGVILNDLLPRFPEDGGD